MASQPENGAKPRQFKLPLTRFETGQNIDLERAVRDMKPGRPTPRPMANVLVLVRHGESEWNKLNRFTGHQDVDLTEEGMAEAHRAGTMLKEAGYQFDIAFSSTLKRAMNSLKIIVGELQQAE